MSQMTTRPKVVARCCTACEECVKICPTGAATIVGETAIINKAKCIRCMCCHEVCRYNAIALRRPFTGTAMYLLTNAVRKIIRH